mmetsp:Transcript_11827/g.27631  ORF Transcript_11827/g.27631 Transcript_11827/m.27631 type:complete len:412 (-) Transcript_11827:92-1327(-)
MLIDEGLRLTGLALVSILVVRIVCLAGRIEWLLSKGAAGGKAGERWAKAAASTRSPAQGGLPHLLGLLLEVNDAAHASPTGAGRPPPLAPPSHKLKRFQTEGGESRALDGLDVAPSEPPSPSLSEVQRRLSLRRTVTIAGSEVAGIIAPLERRSSRGVMAASLSPRLGSEAVRRAQVELEALDVLPLTTAEEAPLLIRMRIELSADLEQIAQHDDVSGDIRLLRFLRGHSHSVEQASAAYRAMLATRSKHDVEAIRQKVLACPLVAEDMPHGKEVYPLYPLQLNCGLSVRGHLVSIDPIGLIQLSLLMEQVGPEKLFEFMIGASELRQMWSLVSTFVSERTKRKIHVLGADYEHTLKTDVGPGVLELLQALHKAGPSKRGSSALPTGPFTARARASGEVASFQEASCARTI